MQITSLRALLFLIYAGFATTASASDADLSGHYEGRIGNTPATLNLRVTGSMVSGRISSADTADVELNGTSTDGRIVGAATTSRGAGFFEVYREFGALVIVIRESGPVTGQPIEARAEFFPADESPKTDNAVDTLAQRDQKLAGTWITRGLARRGDMVLPITTKMILGADGGYSQTSEPPEESRQGEWRSRNGYLEYRPPNAQAWSGLGEYRLHGDNLITIVPGDEPQMWTRRP